MRPLRLEVAGFTCYRDPQPPLDLSGMSLFAIAGPTGAGKSTILDAMLYALYGVVPRMSGKQGLGEFVSHGRDVLSVCLDFSLGGRNYRLTRRARKTKKNSIQTEAIFAELTEAGERNIAGSATAVDAAVEELLGLDFDAFTQTVILPQNQFARFLQSKPKDQRQILQHLLRHEVYDRMRGEAERRKGLLERDVRGKDEQLAHVSGATPEALAAIGVDLVIAQKSLTDAHEERTTASTMLADLQRRRELTIAVERTRETAKVLAGRHPVIGGKRQELKQAQTAAALAPKVQAARTTTQRQQKCEAEVSEAAIAFERVGKAYETARKSLDAAELPAKDIPQHRTALQRLDEISRDVEAKPVLIAELRRLAADLVTSQRTRTDAKTALDASTAKVKSAKLKLGKCVADASALSYDPGLLARLDDLRDDASRARSLEQEIKSHQVKAARTAKQIEDATKKVAARASALELAKAALKSARAARRSAEEARVEGLQRHAAASLRQNLTIGEPCPVCEQAVAKKPRKIVEPELEGLADAVSRATDMEDEASERAKNAAQEATAMGARLSELTDTLDELQRELLTKEKAYRKQLKGISEAITPSGVLSAGDVVAAFESALADVRRTASEHERRQAAVSAGQNALQKAEVEELKAQGASSTADRHLAGVSAELQRQQRELAEVTARIAAVTKAEDPATERDALARRVAALEKQLREAQGAAKESSERFVAAQARLQSAKAANDAVRHELTAVREDLEAALTSHGFSSAEEVEQALQTAEHIAALDKAIREFEQLEASTQSRLAELEPQIAGREVDEAAVATMEARHRAAAAAVDRAVVAATRLGEQVQTLRGNVERALRLAAERAAIAKTLATTGEMAWDLRNDAFQEYLLEEAFKALVVGASVRLREMSRRYTMEWKAGEFSVLDHDNAGERRGAETLSGGETFMASLCLALQLSDEVLHASGAIRMDSLFIDEGFGTLDDGSLGDVTDALENLRQDGDRIIGVISHRPELTDRLPGCIRVDKGVGESKWLVERVG